MQKTKFSPTTKDIALLHQLQQSGQLKLQPEFQRNSVWPRAAKAYLIDTILLHRGHGSTDADAGKLNPATVWRHPKKRVL